MNKVIKKPKNPILMLSSFLFCVFSIISFYEGFNTPLFYVLKYLSLFTFIFSIIYTFSKEIHYKPKRVLIFILISIASSIHLFNIYYINLSNSVFYLILTIFLSFIVLFVLPSIDGEQFNKILSIFLFATVLIVILPSLIKTVDATAYYTVGYRKRFIGIFDNPNELARHALLAIILSLRLFNFYKKLVIKLALFSIVVSSFYIIYATDSRTNLYIGSILVVIYLFLIVICALPNKIKISFVLLLSSSLLVLFFFIFYNLNIATIDLNYITSGRVTIWSSLFNVPLFYKIFGYGQEVTRVVIANGYLEIFRYFGLIGLGLWLLLISGLMFKKLTQKRKKLPDLFSIGIVISFLFFYLFEGGLVSFGNIVSFYFWMELAKNTNSRDL